MSVSAHDSSRRPARSEVGDGQPALHGNNAWAYGVSNFATSAGNDNMKHPGISRRHVLAGAGAVFAGAAFSTRVVAAAPPPEAVTPALIEAAKKEGKVI